MWDNLKVETLERGTGGRVLFKRVRNTASRGLILAALFVVALAGGAAADEVRGIWIDSWHAGFLTQPQVDKLLGVPGSATSKGDIRNANCNTVIVEVRRRADTSYPSGMGEPYMSGLSPSNFNALQAMLNAAHDTTGGKQRIEVHCWMVTFATGGGTVWNAHSDTGNPDNYWPTLNDAGATTSDYAFDPGHPKCEQYIVDVAMDMVNNFDIDGIHYDYIRFTGNNQGYNPTSIARYNARYGLTGQPAASNEQFKQWRRDQISAVVRKVYAKVQSSKPWVKQSGSFVTWNPSPTSSTRAAFQNTRPYYDVYSDWDSWMTEGIVDLAVPMTYYNWASLSSDYTKWMNFEKDRHGNRHMAIGPGTYLNSQANAILELQMTRDASPAGNYADGFSAYDYYTPFSGGSWTSAWVTDLTTNVTPTTANIPVMPWKVSPTKGHISGTATIYGTGAWADGATISITGPETRSMRCDGTGFYAFIDLTPGTYTVTASLTGYANVVKPVTVAIGAVTGNMYVTDFVMGGTTGPTITNVASSGVTDTTATITWTTDQAADSQVEYGLTTSYGSSTPLDSTEVTSHSVGLTGLTPKMTYHYRVHSSNVNGPSVSGDYTFKTAGPPVITSVQATGITSTTATITWTTDVTSDSRVDYGTTTGYGSQQTNASQVTSHSIPLTGLTPNTTYHYQCVSVNTYGTATTGDFTFTTASMAPVISNVQATSITNNSATITWTTDVVADSTVNYGTTTSYGSQQTNPSLVTSHSIALTGLTPKTTYHYQCSSTNAYGTATTGDYTFVTDGPPAISNIQATGITANTATITWITDKASNSTVNYGTTTSYGSQQTNASQVTSHSIALSGLTASTTYHYQCVSTNTYGTDTSTDHTFATPVPVTEIVIDNTDPGWTNTSPGSNTWSVGTRTDVPKIGTNYLYYDGDGSTTESSVTRKCRWTPNLTTTGLYDVYAYYQMGTNRNERAPYKVYYYGSSLTSVQNQNRSVANQGDWFLLGSNLPFMAGSSGYVELSTLSTDTKYVSADAAKWVLKSAQDIVKPTITNIQATSITTNSATITWTTDLASDSKVNYGLTASYGSQQTDPSAVTSHSLPLTGLAPGTAYHYQVASTNVMGTRTSSDFTFDTNGPPTMTSVTDEGYTTSTTELNATWTATDAHSAIARYEYAVGTTAGATDVRDWTSAGTATSYTIGGLSLTIGSAYYISARAVNAEEVTSDPMCSAGVKIARAVASIQEAKGRPDGDIVGLPARVVSAKFADKLYIEEANRVSGIRVESDASVSVGQTVTVFGVMGLANGCERAILSPKVVTGAAGTSITPLLMIGGAVGGSGFNGSTPGITDGIGLNNIGLLVRVTGAVGAIDTDGFYLVDGSKIAGESGIDGIKVWTGSSGSPGTFVKVTGVVSCRASGGKVYPVILATQVTAL